MTKLELDQQKYPHLFEKQICENCGKEFYFKIFQIKNRIKTH